MPDLPQSALSVNMGPQTNVTNLSLAQDALSTTLVETKVKDRITGQDTPVLAIMPSRPPLGLVPTSIAQAGSQRTVGMSTSGLNIMQAFARAQGLLDESSDNAVTVSGTLDSLRYNDVLRARALVDLRGAGFSFDGTWLVRSVTHNIGRGAYTQDFTLSRSALGAMSPFVRVA
jgi:hypothetical protein